MDPRILEPIEAISHSAQADGDGFLWTFRVPNGTLSGAGVYRLQFVRLLTDEEKRK